MEAEEQGKAAPIDAGPKLVLEDREGSLSALSVI